MAKSAKGKKAAGGRKPAKRGAPKPSRDQTVGPKDNIKNGLDPDSEKQLFLHHRGPWNDWKAKRKVIDELEREVKANLKGDGFTVKQFEIADQLLTLKGEKKVTAEVSDRLKVAHWIGHPMGNQLDLFADGGGAKRAKTLDDYYAEGKQTSMEGKSPKPPSHIAPGSPEYESFMSGYNDDQERIGKGFRKPEGEGESEPVQRPAGSRFGPLREVISEGDKLTRTAGQ